MEQTFQPVILFDGVCNFCNTMVNWVLDRDPVGVFRFASLQSPAGRQLLAAYPNLPDSVILVDEQGVHTRSQACLRIAGRLGLPWRLLRILSLFPTPLLDAGYAWIARNRYRWFGQREACRPPEGKDIGRFLDSSEIGRQAFCPDKITSLWPGGAERESDQVKETEPRQPGIFQ